MRFSWVPADWQLSIVSCQQLKVVQSRKYAFHMLTAHWQLLIVSCRQFKVVQNRKYAFHMLTAHWQLFMSGQLKVVKRLRPAQ